MSHQIVTLDVREEIRAGGAPCARIMGCAGRLAEGDTLRLLVPFEPTPLYEVLGRQGFEHASRALENGDWEVQFVRTAPVGSAPPDADTRVGNPTGCGCREAGGRTIDLDLRGLEPPQPMIRILEALTDLPEDSGIRAITDRRPIHLLDHLEARGFQAHTEESPDRGHITVIRRR